MVLNHRNANEERLPEGATTQERQGNLDDCDTQDRGRPEFKTTKRALS